MANLSNLLVKYTFLGGYSWLNEVYKTMPIILYCILAIAGGAGAVYAVILGINLAKADSDDTRKKSADRLKNTIIGVAVLLVLIVFINEILPLILAAALPQGMVIKG